MTAASLPVGRDKVEEQSLQRRFAYIARLLRRDRGGMIGFALFILIVLAAIFAPVIAPHDPVKQNLRAAKQPLAWQAVGSWEFPLGTVTLGRDSWSNTAARLVACCPNWGHWAERSTPES